MSGDREVDPKLLEILVCPLTKTPLRYDRSARELISDQAGLAFPIRNGVPIMLVDDARTLDDDPVSEGVAALADQRKDGAER
ncbi:MAG: Trm112 family protein [Alphaproteobacteria bacterium]|nr:Trm112 family protein [Alphaproteobacteria bacterium]